MFVCHLTHVKRDTYVRRTVRAGLEGVRLRESSLICIFWWSNVDYIILNITNSKNSPSWIRSWITQAVFCDFKNVPHLFQRRKCVKLLKWCQNCKKILQEPSIKQHKNLLADGRSIILEVLIKHSGAFSYVAVVLLKSTVVNVRESWAKTTKKNWKRNK